MIDSHRFGEIVIEGGRYISDVIILPLSVRGWWRKQGHELCFSPCPWVEK